MHDSNLGRTTNAFEAEGSTEYDPYERTGYNPNISAFAHNDFTLRLRRPNLSGYTNEHLVNLDEILNAIKVHKISMILLLDVKDIEAARKAWQIVKVHKNAWGTPAERWVYFKMPVSSIGVRPSDFEAKGIMDPEVDGARFRLIPVFGADSIDASGGIEANMDNWASYYAKPYVYATEVRLKEYDNSLAFPLNNIMSRYYGMRTEGPTKTVGAYQPVPETQSYSYFAADGHCCTEPKYWLWSSKKGLGKETGDNRPSLNWLMNTASGSFRYIITDDPLTAMSELKKDGRRNEDLIRNP